MPACDVRLVITLQFKSLWVLKISGRPLVNASFRASGQNWPARRWPATRRMHFTTGRSHLQAGPYQGLDCEVDGPCRQDVLTIEWCSDRPSVSSGASGNERAGFRSPSGQNFSRGGAVVVFAERPNRAVGDRPIGTVKRWIGPDRDECPPPQARGKLRRSPDAVRLRRPLRRGCAESREADCRENPSDHDVPHGALRTVEVCVLR